MANAKSRIIVVVLFGAIAVALAAFLGLRVWARGVQANAVQADPSASTFIKGPVPTSWSPQSK